MEWNGGCRKRVFNDKRHTLFEFYKRWVIHFMSRGIIHFAISKYFKTQFSASVSWFLGGFMSGVFRACWPVDLIERLILPI